MYERYAALFALRNDGGDYAVSAIIEALGVKSALLRHEVCLNFNQFCLLCYHKHKLWKIVSSFKLTKFKEQG